MQSFWECVVGCTCLLCFSWQWLFVNCILCFEQAKVRNKKHFLLLFSLYLQHQIKLFIYSIMAETSNTQHVLKSQANWDALYFYQKSDVIYQLAFAFCERFIHLYKDRTRDQVI